MLKRNINQDFSPFKGYLLLAFALFLTSVVTLFLYFSTQWFLKWSLQQRVLAIVNTASLQFSANELDKIRGMQSADDFLYKNIVLQLQKIKISNDNVKYAYIQRATDQPSVLEFVADADALFPNDPIDLNENGQIDADEELSKPGDLYDVSEYPEFIKIAFEKSYVDPELSKDQWGSHLAATAPIPTSQSDAKYLLGVDIDASDFVRLTSLLQVPFLLFIIFLVLVLIGLTVSTARIWKSRLEIIAENDRQKDELLGLVSHQLATPVSGLRWNLEMIVDGDLGPLNEKQKDEMQTMQGVVGNLSDLVSMILDVSRIQLGKMKVDKASIDLKQFFKEITDVLAPRAHEKKIQFDVRVPENLGNGFIDKRLTHMTVENLISNAVKYTPENGKVSVDVSLQNGMLRCIVQDTGCGIPEADQGKIFGKLYRASNVAAVDGNGFGLFVAKGAIEAQGGKIWFESEEGKGTKFFVMLPTTQAKAAEPPK